MQPAKATTGRKRPVAVTLVGLLALAAGVYHLVGGGMTVGDGGDASKLAEGVFGLTHQLLRHFFYSDESYPMLAVDMVVVLALTPLDIQVAFGARSRPSLDLDHGAYVGDAGS